MLLNSSRSSIKKQEAISYSPLSPPPKKIIFFMPDQFWGGIDEVASRYIPCILMVR